MQSLLQRVSFYLHCSLDVNKDKMIPSKDINEFTLSLQSNNNQSDFGRQRRKLLQLSASHSTRISTSITSISGPGLHVDDLKSLV